LGAAEAFDYNDPDCAKKIRQYANDNLKYIWDPIGLPASAQICADAISVGGVYGTFINKNFTRPGVKTVHSLAYTAIGEPVKKGAFDYPDNTRDFEFAKKWIAAVEAILQEGRLKVHPPQVEHGLENVFDGLDLLRHDRVSGKKMVYVL
jgi:NADPH:quinone reductase-like Zn-dependent oxidoreductase